MITWIQTALLKHAKWLFIVLLVVVSVSFVFTFGVQGSSFDPAHLFESPQSFFGKNMRDPEVVRPMIEEAHVSGMLANLPTVQDDNGRQRLAFERTAQLALADRLLVPGPTTPEAERDFLRTRPAFQRPEGPTAEMLDQQIALYVEAMGLGEELIANFFAREPVAAGGANFSPEQYENFTKLVDGRRFNANGVARALRNDARIQQVRQLLRGTPVMLPLEAELRAKAAKTSYQVVVARLPYATFQPEIAVTEEALQAHYQANLELFKAPALRAYNVVVFSTEAALNRMPEPTEQELLNYFEANKDTYRAAPTPPATEGGEPTPAPEPVFAEVRDRVTADYRNLRRGEAQRTAGQAANRFLQALQRESLRDPASPRIPVLAAELGGTFSPLPPIDPANPAESPLATAEQFRAVVAATQRTGTRAVQEVRDGTGIFFFTEEIAARQREFAEARAAVEADYKETQRRAQYNARTAALADALKAELAAGKTFAESAASAGLTVESPEAFAAEAPPATVDRDLFEVMQAAAAGELVSLLRPQPSPQQPQQDARFGLVLSVTAPTAETIATATTLQRLANAARVRGALNLNAAVAEVMERELRKAGLEAR